MRRDAGLRFSEIMSGRFALGTDDPESGARAASDHLVLQATLTIDNMERFLRDRSHEGSLVGAVTFPALGSAIPSVDGRFNLFAPTSDPDLKLMVYRLTFAARDEVYTLHGEKHVRRGSMLRGWPDTTTLRCRLHAGADTTGAVRGAGILRINPAGFARQLVSFRTVNGSSAGARAHAMVGFLSFFSRELLDSYLWRRSFAR